MTKYKGNKSTLKWTGITLLAFIGIIFLIYFFTQRGFLSWFFMIGLFLMCIPTYRGMIVSISMDKDKVIIRRPLTWQVIRLSNVAFCAVHDIGEGRSLIFVFMRYRWGSTYKIRGIKSKKSYQETMMILSKGGRIQDVKINFNKASKIPVSLVENGEELKERILDSVDAHHMKAVISDY